MPRCPYWVRPRLGGCRLPGPGDLRRLAREGVTLIVSLPEDHEFLDAWPGGVREFLEYAGELGIRVHRLPTPDFGAPGQEEACRAYRLVRGEIEAGGKVVVHCYGGIGRTGTFLAGYLVVSEGLSPEEAVEELARYGAGPQSPEQEYFLYAVSRLAAAGQC